MQFTTFRNDKPKSFEFDSEPIVDFISSEFNLTRDGAKDFLFLEISEMIHSLEEGDIYSQPTVFDTIDNDVYMINNMLTLQMSLDEKILETKEKKDLFSLDNLDMAIIDEIGELTHELKGRWCWWKDNQNPVERQRVLEELVDVWHFVLMKHYKTEGEDKFYSVEDYMNFLYWHFKHGGRIYENYTYIPHFLSTNYEIDDVLALTYCLGFTLSDVYDEYIHKNQINLARVDNGY